MTNPGDTARDNFSWLQNNPYPGRGIVAGMDETGDYLVQIYWIMGRSENSRNRIFACDAKSGRLYTQAADPTKVEDPSLIIYNAMRCVGSSHVVSNGDQTDTVVKNCAFTLNLNARLACRTYEPDTPNFTQRITAISSIGEQGHTVQMSILRKSVFGEECDQLWYQYTPKPGFGHCITTYAGDGDPLPPFRGDPLLMPIIGSIDETAGDYWDALNEDNRVSLAVKIIPIRSDSRTMDIRIINKRKAVL